MTREELIKKIEELKKEKSRLSDLANVQDLQQHAYKIFLNSAYGALGSAFYPCYDLDNAESVTLSGQAVTREMVNYTNKILNQLINNEVPDEFVVAGDTDSIYVKMDAVIKHLFGVDKVDWNNKETFEKIKDFVDNVFQAQLNNYCADFICNKFHTDQRRIEFKREKLSAQAEYTAKKRYIVHVYNNEGIDCNKWSYTGVDIKKNELPESIKKLLEDCVQGLIEFNWDNSTYQSKIKEIYNIFENLEIKDMAYIKNLNTPKEATGFLNMEKGAGAHARAAEYYNQIIKELKLTYKYEEIHRGDRFQYVYIKPGNRFGINVIGFKDRWPTEFDEIFEVDRIKMFEKECLAPMKTIEENHKFSTFNPNAIPIESKSGKSLFDL